MLMPNEERTDAYLSRIGARRPDRPDAASLAVLQLSHMLRVPFENLDIHRGVPIVLDLESIIGKVVYRRRGGYCYELNSAFASLLATFGYRVHLVSARVARTDGAFGAEFDHMALIAHAEDVAGPLLVDVGFGDAFTMPIPIAEDREQADRDRMVRLVRDGARWIYQEDRGDGWQAQYSFTTVPRLLADFADRNEWQQTSPDSHFTSQTICSLPTAEGRITLSGDRLITTVAGVRNERQLGADEVEAVLRDRFGIQFPPDQGADALWSVSAPRQPQQRQNG